MRLVLACLVTFLLFWITPGYIAAHGGYKFESVSEGVIEEALLKVVPVRFLVSHPLYFLISAKENVSRFFKPSAAKKAEFDTTLAGKKLKEAYLLLLRDDVKNSSRTLVLYKNRVEMMVSQLEKARSQKQDVVSLVDFMAEELRVQETLFFGILKKYDEKEDSFSFDENFREAIVAHANAVLAIENVKAGVKDRFTTDDVIAPEESVPLPYPSPPFQEVTPSAKPRRIIL